ncbi:hypothetical protein JOQ06_006483, partial [Pogonophryne albipinna]
FKHMKVSTGSEEGVQAAVSSFFSCSGCEAAETRPADAYRRRSLSFVLRVSANSGDLCPRASTCEDFLVSQLQVFHVFLQEIRPEGQASVLTVWSNLSCEFPVSPLCPPVFPCVPRCVPVCPRCVPAVSPCVPGVSPVCPCVSLCVPGVSPVCPCVSLCVPGVSLCVPGVSPVCPLCVPGVSPVCPCVSPVCPLVREAVFVLMLQDPPVAPVPPGTLGAALFVRFVFNLSMILLILPSGSPQL